MIESNIKSQFENLTGNNTNKHSNLFNEPVSNIEFKKVIKNYSLKIIGLEKELKILKGDIENHIEIISQLINDNKYLKSNLENLIEENNNLKNNFSENVKLLEETKKEFLSNKKWFKWFIGIFIIVFAGWCIETFYRFHNVKEDYINQTKEIQNEIKEFKKEIENLKEDNGKLKENIKNEIEKEIYKTILQKN